MSRAPLALLLIAPLALLAGCTSASDKDDTAAPADDTAVDDTDPSDTDSGDTDSGDTDTDTDTDTNTDTDSGDTDTTETDCDVVWFRDADGDGHGVPEDTLGDCIQPEGYVGSDDDCDDADNTVYPGSPELCDGRANACDATGWTVEAEAGTVTQWPADGSAPVSHTDAWAAGTDAAMAAVTVSSGEWAVCEGEFWVTATVEGRAVLAGAGQGLTVLRAHNEARILDVRAELELVDLTLSEGYSEADGGAVFVTDADFSARNVTFDYGTAQRGGAVAGSYTAPARLLLEDTLMVGPSGVDGGGCVYVEGPVDVSIARSELAFCFAEAGNGGAVYGADAGTLVVEDTTFTLAYAGGDGGSVAWQGDAVTISAGTFAQSSAAGDGGAVAATAATVSIADSSFIDACYAGGDGGAVWLSWTDAAAVERTYTTYARAVGNGGGIAAYGAAGSTLSLLDLTLEDGDAASGGAVYASTASIAVDGGSYVRNEATDGGAFLIDGAPLAAFGVGARVEDNVASSRGGGLYAVSSSVTVTGDETTLDGFRRNASEFGGAICYEPGAGQTLTAYTADFGEEEDDNVAPNGDDVYIFGYEGNYGDGESFVCDDTDGCY